MRKELGKITRFDVGMGGYDDAMFGLSVTFSFQGSGVQDFIGTWAHKPDERCKWTLKEQGDYWADMCRNIIELLKKAKVKTTTEMVGIPVEVTFDGNRLSSWRILEEVL